MAWVGLDSGLGWLDVARFMAWVGLAWLGLAWHFRGRWLGLGLNQAKPSQKPLSQPKPEIISGLGWLEYLWLGLAWLGFSRGLGLGWLNLSQGKPSDGLSQANPSLSTMVYTCLYLISSEQTKGLCS